jgi:hypothetical protein
VTKLDTAAFVADSPLPPVDDIDRSAEILLTLAHRSVNWDVWGGPKAMRYWDALTDRSRTAVYAGPSLGDWWQRMTTSMQLSPPHTKADRLLLAELLSCGHDREILDAFRNRSHLLVLRVRVNVEHHKEAHITATEDSIDE